MANYEGYARSNYFKVKNVEEFEAFCRQWHLLKIHQEVSGGDTSYGFLVENGGIPSELPNDDEPEGESEPGRFSKSLAGQLAEGEVAIVMEVGYERLRYLVGYSLIVNWKGEEEVVNLEAETMKLASLWNADVTAVEA